MTGGHTTKREFITGLLPDIDKDILDQIMTEHGKDIKTQKTTISTLQTQLDTANGKLEGFDPDWKTKTENARRELEAQQFDFALSKAISEAKPRNAKAVMALLDRDKFKFAGGEMIGIDTQFEVLKKGDDKSFLFASIDIHALQLRF